MTCTEKKSSIVIVAGPTASGKSDFAQELALEIQGEILNADSQQFYRGLDIGTGKLPVSNQKVPHWLFDLCDPGQRMNAGEFSRLADQKILEIVGRGKVPIVVGGTGLYLKTLVEGIDDLPPRDPVLRARLEQRLQEQGVASLYEELKRVDPAAALRIAPQDRSRVIRFLEIHELSGQPVAHFFQKHPRDALRYQVRSYWLNPERAWLRQRIAQRVHQMIHSGWLQEVAGLMRDGEDPRLWESQPIGYLELAEHLRENSLLEQVEANIVHKTRQYAKRQDTFFRGMFKNPLYQRGLSMVTDGPTFTTE